MAIEFSMNSYEDPEVCKKLRPFVAAGIDLLRNPDDLATDPGERPFAQWDGCGFLVSLLADKAKNYDSYRPYGTADPFSGCNTSHKAPAGSEPDRSAPSLRVYYDEWDEPMADTKKTISGKTVYVSKHERSCLMKWRQTSSGVPIESLSSMVMEISTGRCSLTERLVSKAIELAPTQPPEPHVQPQRPLLYAPDERSSAAEGACLHYAGSLATCEPYHPTKVPETPKQLFTAAAENVNVDCALFLDAVHAVLGKSVKAVTAGTSCVFVEPTHTIEIVTSIYARDAPAEYGNSQYTSNWKIVEFASVEAVSYFSRNRSAYSILLSPYDNVHKSGNIRIVIRGGPGRGLMTEKPELEQTDFDAIRKIMTKVAKTYFN